MKGKKGKPTAELANSLRIKGKKLLASDGFIDQSLRIANDNPKYAGSYSFSTKRLLMVTYDYNPRNCSHSWNKWI